MQLHGMLPIVPGCACLVAICGLVSGMELYPRLGKSFDLKTWTNCRMGMMGWAFWILCFAVKQHQTFGHVSKAMMVSVVLMEIYIFKFFL